MIKQKHSFKTEDLEIGDRAYETGHIEKVLEEIMRNFSDYFKSFCDNKDEQHPLISNPNFKIVTKHKKKVNHETLLTSKFQNTIDDFDIEQPSYQSFFDLDGLKEYEDDPNTFKKDLSKKIPLIRRSLQSTANDMKKFQSNFWQKSGRELLDVTHNIILFANKHIKTFDNEKHEEAKSVEDLSLSELSEEKYISHLVIGGGIKSCFLFSLFPNAFPYRSQDALWSLWYLTNKNDFGFKDYSEFLMVHPDEGKTHQNYHYPYDLFSFYALKIYLLLQESCNKEGVLFQNQFRYIYLDSFFNHITEIKQNEIADLKKDGDYEE